MAKTCQRAIFPGEILTPTHPKPLVPRTMRVLQVQEGELDRIVMIAVEPVTSHRRKYFQGPITLHLSAVQSELARNHCRIVEGGVAPRPDAVATDEELDRKYWRSRQVKSGTRIKREERWALIEPLVRTYDDRVLLLDPQIRGERIAARAADLSSNNNPLKSLIRRINFLLNQYWAGGSTRGALTPFDDARGGRGTERKQRKKLGRCNAPTKAGKSEQQGFVLSGQDKDICGFGWRNYYIRGKTIAKALRRTWREFYANITTNKRGQAVHTLYPINQRPTRKQFITWGGKRSPGHEAWKSQLTKFTMARIDHALLGSANENVTAIGQLGAMDSTGVDISFVSVLNRLKRIGGAHRILIIDSKYGYIPGFYLGLDAPSATTVRLAMLHAISDKTEWLSWLGLDDQDPNDWLRIQFARLVADNTDLRCAAVEECLESINCGVQFVPVARSDMNSCVESAHHILHRAVDHNLFGTTHGQKKERGETSPDEHACHTILEANRETARAIHAHNTMELDVIPTLAAHRELVAQNIPLTRLNLTRWDIARGKVATSLISIQEARMKLLMPIRGTFTKNGVKLLRPDRGDRREFVEPLRYIARDINFVKHTIRAKVMRGRAAPDDWDDNFLHAPYQPSHIYHRDSVTGQLTQLDAKVAGDDSERLLECSLPDMLELMDACALDRFNARIARDDALSDLEDGQDRTNEESKATYQRDLDEAPKKPSKIAMKRDKKANREAEKAVLIYGTPVAPAIDAIEAEPHPGEEPVQPPIDDSEGPVPAPQLPIVTPPPPPPSPTTSASPLVLSILKRIAERSRNV